MCAILSRKIRECARYCRVRKPAADCLAFNAILGSCACLCSLGWDLLCAVGLVERCEFE